MKKILLLVVVCCALMGAQAQRVYFMYLQTDNKSPFYLKTGDKVYSSTASGYLIVPRLVDSTYNVVIGKSGATEARFTIPINGKDKGFLLRESSQKLSLFDLQTMAIIEASTSGSAPVSYTERTDRFTTLLSQAADDPSLLQMVVYTPAEKKPDPKPAEPIVAVMETTEAPKQTTARQEPPVPVKDTQTTVAQSPQQTIVADTVVALAEKEPVKQQEAAVAKTEVVKEEPVQTIAKEPAGEEVVYKRSIVTRRAESSTSEGFGLVFTDNVDGVIDTIRLVIPNPKTIFQTGAEEVVKEDKRFLEMQKEATKKKPEPKQEIQKETGKKRISLFGKKENNKEENEDVKVPEPKKEATVKKEEGCRSNASDNDVARLRRNMVGKSSEEDMIGEGQKYFKSKCFTTQQIKGLSSLLLTSAGRYLFFEAAYNQVSDKENFSTLQNELWDRNDINRFKALMAK